MSRELATMYMRGQYVVAAISSEYVRIDIDTEDGSVVSSILIINDASEFVRDVARAISDAKRMT